MSGGRNERALSLFPDRSFQHFIIKHGITCEFLQMLFIMLNKFVPFPCVLSVLCFVFCVFFLYSIRDWFYCLVYTWVAYLGTSGLIEWIRPLPPFCNILGDFQRHWCNSSLNVYKKIREKKRDTFKYFILMSIVATPFTIQQAVNKGASLAFVVVSFLLWFIFIICVWMIFAYKYVCMCVCMPQVCLVLQGL